MNEYWIQDSSTQIIDYVFTMKPTNFKPGQQIGKIRMSFDEHGEEKADDIYSK